MLRLSGVCLAVVIIVWGALPVVARAQSSGGSGAISGRVTFVGGKPAPRKVVQYQPLGDKNGGNTTVTDLEGNYSFKGLGDGVYLVGFFHPDRVPADEPSNQGLISDPNADAETVARLGAAPLVKRVEIKGGAEITGVDFTITDIGPETVEGPEVTGADLEPVTLPATGERDVVSDRSVRRGRWLIALVALTGAAVAAAYLHRRAS